MSSKSSDLELISEGQIGVYVKLIAKINHSINQVIHKLINLWLFMIAFDLVPEASQ